MTALARSLASRLTGAHPRRHDLAGGAGAELHRALHQLGGVGVEGALVGGALRSSEASSVELRAERSSSCGSMPRRRTIALAEPLSSRIGPAHHGGEAAQEALGGAGGLHRLGDREVLGHQLAEDHRQRRCRGPGRCATAIGVHRTPRARRRRSSGPSIRSAIAGSARKPMARLVTVMPTWAPESWVDSERSAAARPGRRASPSAAACSTRAAVDGDEGELGGHEDAARGDEQQGERRAGATRSSALSRRGQGERATLRAVHGGLVLTVAIGGKKHSTGASRRPPSPRGHEHRGTEVPQLGAGALRADCRAPPRGRGWVPVAASSAGCASWT